MHASNVPEFLLASTCYPNEVLLFEKVSCGPQPPAAAGAPVAAPAPNLPIVGFTEVHAWNAGDACNTEYLIHYAQSRCYPQFSLKSLVVVCTTETNAQTRRYNSTDCTGSYTIDSNTNYPACNPASGGQYKCPVVAPIATPPYVLVDNYRNGDHCGLGYPELIETSTIFLPRCKLDRTSNTSTTTFCNETGIYKTDCVDSLNCTGDCTTNGSSFVWFALWCSDCSHSRAPGRGLRRTFNPKVHPHSTTDSSSSASSSASSSQGSRRWHSSRWIGFLSGRRAPGYFRCTSRRLWRPDRSSSKSPCTKCSGS